MNEIFEFYQNLYTSEGTDPEAQAEILQKTQFSRFTGSGGVY